MSPETAEPCSGCGSQAALRCSRCLGARYCSKECQKRHWPKHKLECRPKNNEDSQELYRPTSKEEAPCAECCKPTVLRCSSCHKVFYCSKLCQQNNRPRHKQQCFPFKVENNDIVGRHVIATKDIKAGDIILKEEPLVLSPLEPQTLICLGCHRVVDGKYRCRGCCWPVCGEQCERLPTHNAECRVLSSSELSKSLNMASYKVVYIVRCLELMGDPEKLEKLMNFQNHKTERQAMKIKIQAEKSILSELKKMKIQFKLNKKVDSLENFVAHVMGAIDVNGFEIQKVNSEIVGMYPVAALVEHSCIPNTKHRFSTSNQIVLKASMDIKEGEHITTTYTKILWGTMARRKDLLEHKYFQCSCRRCSDATEFDTYFSALKCKNCKQGYCLPENPLNNESRWTCDSCKGFISSNEAENRTATLGNKVESIMSNPEAEKLEYLLKDCTANDAHHNHFHLFKARHTLLQLYGRGPSATKEETLRKKEIMCREFLDICAKFDPGDGRLGPFTGVALFEYHELVLTRAQKLASKEYPDEKLINQCIALAKNLLTKCIKTLQDEQENSPEGQLRIIAQKKLAEIGLLASSKNF